MAEFIIGAVALGVAAPGVVVAFTQCGAYFTEQISKIKNAPSLVQDMARYGTGLHGGQIKQNIDLAAWAYTQQDLTSELKDTLEDQINRLKEALIQADKVLQKSFDERGQVRRGYFFIKGERKLKKILGDLDKWQNDFWISMSLIDMRRSLLPDPLLLSNNIFKVHPQKYFQDVFQPEQSQHMLVAKGQIFQGAMREVTILIEKSPSEDLVSVKDIAGCLASNSSSRGILKCLGYRESSEPELVFEIPNGYTEMQTLQRVIAADQSLGYGGARPLDYRFQLSRQIAEAVLSIHASKRVHKNIWPSNILLLKSNDIDKTQIGSPFLIDWKMLRSTDMPSSMIGDHDWLKDIYRHPQRQGLQPEQRYNMGHDIYSLGVCMLEIGLWEPLVVLGESDCMLHLRYRQLAVEIGAVEAQDIANLKALTHPLVVQDVFVALAKKELPQRMGIAYAELVASCLTCLEGGPFGDAKEFEDNKIAMGVRFRDLVLEPLSSLA